MFCDDSNKRKREWWERRLPWPSFINVYWRFWYMKRFPKRRLGKNYLRQYAIFGRWILQVSCLTSTWSMDWMLLSLFSLYYTILHYTVLNYAMLYYTILYYAMLCYTFRAFTWRWLLCRGIFNVLAYFAGKIGFMRSHSRDYNIQFPPF